VDAGEVAIGVQHRCQVAVGEDWGWLEAHGVCVVVTVARVGIRRLNCPVTLGRLQQLLHTSNFHRRLDSLLLLH